MDDGSQIVIVVKDAQTVTRDGFVYSVNGNTTTVTRRSTTNSGTLVSNDAPITTVTSVPTSAFPRGSVAMLDMSYLNNLFPDSVNVPNLITTNDDVAALNADPTTIKPGNQNNNSKTQVWKKTQVDPDTGNLEILMSFFQKQGTPIDFIIACDETGSMANIARATVEGVQKSAPRYIWARAAMLKAANALLDANTRAGEQAYQNRVAFLIWDNRDQYASDFYNNYNDANAWAATKYTGHNGTNHAQTFQTLLGMLDRSRSSNPEATRVVIYLSDFADGGTATTLVTYRGVRDRVRNHLNENCVIYGLNMFGGNRVTSIQEAISRQGHNYVAGDDPSRLLPAIEEIIIDAISNAETNLTIVDTLSEGVNALARQNGITTENVKGESVAGVYDPDKGTVTWGLNNGATTQTVDGESVTSIKPLKTGQVYTQKIIIPTNSGDTIYSGSMSTNQKMTLTGVTPENAVIESDPPGEGETRALILRTPVKFVKALIDRDGNKVEDHTLSGISFTLSGDNMSDVTLTSDENGAFSVPYSQCAFEKGKTYRLQENVDSVDAFNAGNPSKKIFAARNAWLLTVNDDYTITATVDGGTDAVHTSPMTIKNGAFRVWNEEKIEAELIPITIKKIWEGSDKRQPVQFTVHGVENGTKYPLTAYRERSVDSAVVNTLIGSAGEKEWSMTVYVPSMINDGTIHEFYTDKKLAEADFPSQDAYKINNSDTDMRTPAQLVQDMGDGTVFRYSQTFSYTITEDNDMVDNEGWFVPTYDAETIDKYFVGDWSPEQQGSSSWVSYDQPTADYQLHFDIDEFDYGRGNGNFTTFRSVLSNNGDVDTYAELKKFYTSLDSITLGIRDENKSPAELFKVTFNPNKTGYSSTNFYKNGNGGADFQGIELPAAWSAYGTEDGYKIKGIRIVFISVNVGGNVFNIYGTDPQTRVSANSGNNLPHSPDQPNATQRARIMTNGAASSRQVSRTTVTNFTGGLTYLKVVPAVASEQVGKYIVRECTLSIENSWMENTLAEATLIKNWVNSEGTTLAVPAYEKDQDIHFKVKATTESGNTTYVPAFKSKGGHYSATNELTKDADGYYIMPRPGVEQPETDPENPTNHPTVANTDGTQWTKLVFVPSYDTSTYVRTAYGVTCDAYTSFILEEKPLEILPDGVNVGNPGEWQQAVAEAVTEQVEVTIVPEIPEVPAVPGRNNTPTAKDHTAYLAFTPENIKASDRYVTIWLGLFSIQIPARDARYTSVTLQQVVMQYECDGVTYNTTVNCSKDILDNCDAQSTCSLKFFTEMEIPNNATNITIVSATAYITGRARRIVTWENFAQTLDIELNNVSISSTSSGTLINTNQANTTELATDAGTPAIPAVPAVTQTITAYKPTLTNTFVPYKLVNITASFDDGTADKASTDLINSVHYAVTNQTTGETYGLDVPVSISGGSGSGVRAVYVPRGSYTVTQESYTLSTGAVVNLVQNNPYDVTVTGDVTANGGTVIIGDNDVGCVFNNNRKNYPVKVRMTWEPALDASANEDPFAGQPTVSYQLSYYKASDNTTAAAATGTLHVDHTDGDPASDLLGTYNDDVPSYSVLGEPFSPNLSSGENSATLEQVLPDWNTTVETTIEGGYMVYTFASHLKRGTLTLSKIWEKEAADDHPDTLTLTLKRSDSKPFAIGNGSAEASHTYTLKENPDPGKEAWAEEITGLPVLKSYGAESSVYYIVTETIDTTKYDAEFTDGWQGEKKVNDQTVTDQGWVRLSAKGTKQNFVNGAEVLEPVLLNDDEIQANVSISNFPKRTKFTISKTWDNANIGLDPTSTDYASTLSRLTEDRTVTVALYSISNYTGSAIQFTDQQSAKNNFDTLTAQYGDSRHKFYSEYELNADNNWEVVVEDLPATDTYYAFETAIDGMDVSVGEPMSGTFAPAYVYHMGTSIDDPGTLTITNQLPICKIVVGDDEYPFSTLNGAVTYARTELSGTAVIEMLVDYVIPASDKVTLNHATDSITITTAATSGGVYNFVPTFDIDQGRTTVYKADGSYESGDSASVAILQRGWDGGVTNNQALFYLDNSAGLTTQNIILDGKSKVGTDTAVTQKTGRAIYVNNGSLGANGNTTFRNFNLSGNNANGGAVYANSALTYTVSDTGNVLFDNCTVTGDGGAVYAKNTLSMTASVPGTLTFTRCTADQGGGIYQSTGDMTLTNATFGASGDESKGCFAENEGGSVYSAGTNATVTDCSFYYSKAGSGLNENNTHGGAVCFNGNPGTYEILGCVFDHCSANTMKDDIGRGNGGAVYIGQNATSLTIDSSTRRSSFTSCSAYRFGGAVILEKNGGSTLSISHTDFTDCHTEIRGGGAVFSDSDDTTFEDCTFKGCYTKPTSGEYGGGGAIYMNGDTKDIASTIAITGCQFEDCYVNTNGGAINFYSTKTAATLTNVQIAGHTTGGLAATTANAVNGGAIYSRGNVTIKQSGTSTCEIKNCSASGANGGAINMYSGKSVSFEGDVVVYDNGTMNSSGTVTAQKNMVLDQDQNTMIQTTATGLGTGAHIGVYVTDTDPYTKHGTLGLPFGTRQGGTTATDKNLEKFTNDRVDGLFGVDSTDAGKGTTALIYWGCYICKIVDNNSDEHPFPTLNKAVTYARENNGKTLTMDATNSVAIQMLTDYVIPATDQVTLNQANDSIILTTAPTAATFTGEKYFFATTFTATQGRLSTDSAEIAILRRGYTGGSLFTVSNANASLSFNTTGYTGVILDGNSAAYTCNTEGGIIKATAGAITVNDGTTMRNTKTNSKAGGAIYAGKDAGLTVNGTKTGTDYGVSFANCEATYGGAIAHEYEAAKTTVKGSSFSNCKTTGATDKQGGGAICTRATEADIQYCGFTDCSTKTGSGVMQGGAILHAGPNKDTKIINGTTTINYCEFVNCQSAGAGGAADLETDTVTVENSTFSNCDSSQGQDKDGGALDVSPRDSWQTYDTTGTSLTVSNCIFFSTSAGRAGGAIRSLAQQNAITDSTFRECVSTSSIDKAHGGAILFRNKTAGAYATVSGCAFENCESHGTDRHGGAIHSEVNTLTIQSSANNRTSFVNCYAVGNGGAIYSKAGSGTNQGTFISNCTFDGHESYSRTNPDGTTYDYTFDEPNKNASNGGAIYIESGLLSITGTTIRDCSVTNSGGAIFMSGADKTNPTLSLADTAKPNMIQNCSAAYYGGAVYLSKGTKTKGSEMVLSDGSTIIGNRAGIAGAGIYLDEGTKLNISGKPNFGGTGTDANGNPITSATDAQGNTIATGNFVTMTGYADKLNGTVKYGSDDIREDIYIEGYIGTQGGPIPATSLNVTGQITSGNGTIWVWAETPTAGTQADENNHYHELRQFATFTVAPDENTLKSFRNAVPDDITENGTDSYLTGTVEGDLTVPSGSTYNGYIYWNGIAGTRKVILRKVNKDYNSLSGKTFNIYKGSSSAPYNYKAPGATAAVALSGLSSLNSGVFWIGNLPYGWYIVEETETGTASKYFFLVVTAKGTYGTIDADGNNVVDGYNNRTNAETRAKAVYDANK